ncbi:uncharacterized protein LOC115216439 [Octopus sinensis]|uniref:Uncharacterized protein LOC115216439 n=1 Tax=Octopus sinensis TaxID=2607531 RepID=A0A6P7STN1_9MOLL|nr:uncharacterized protein LOC115216439 [Octopus sinensis]XP_029641638.1 uncharacterized protein LOC115216439 [Octopus sinensis]
MNENESQSNERTLTEDLNRNTLEDNPEYRFQNACCLHRFFRKIFRCLFFLKRFSSNAQKYIIWILIIVLSLSGGLYLRCYVFQKRSVVLLPLDISVVDTIMPLFCSSVSICYKGSKIKVHVLSEKPELSNEQVQHSYTDSFILREENEKIWPISLQQNSSLSMTLCSKGLSEIGLITGKENFEKWESEKGCSQCLESFTVDSTCLKFNLSQPTANMHYIVFKSIGKGSLIKADISLKRTLYKIQGSDFHFKKNSNCFKIPVKMQSSEYILLQSLSKKWEFIPVTIVYNTRNYIFIIFFLVLPCFLGSLIFSMTERLFNNYSDEDLEIEDHTSTLSVIEYLDSNSPPSYDSIFPENDPNTLPSYQKCAEIGIPKTS